MVDEDGGRGTSRYEPSLGAVRTLVAVALLVWTAQALAQPLLVIITGIYLALMVLPVHDAVRTRMPDALRGVGAPIAVLGPSLLVLGAVVPTIGFAIAARAEGANVRSTIQEAADAVRSHVQGMPLVGMGGGEGGKGPLAELGGTIAGQVAGMLESVAGGLVGVGLAIFVAILVLWERDRWRSLGREWSPDGDEEAIGRFAHRTGELVRRYLVVKTAVGVVAGVVVGVTCLLSGVKGAVLWGLLVWFFSYVPNLGAFISAIFPIGAALATQGPGTAAVIAVVMAVNEQVTGNMLAPRLLGRAVDVQPSVALASVLIMGAVWGTGGVLLGVPLLLTWKVWHDEVADQRS